MFLLTLRFNWPRSPLLRAPLVRQGDKQEDQDQAEGVIGPGRPSREGPGSLTWIRDLQVMKPLHRTRF